MNVLVDTNLLLRSVQHGHPMRPTADAAVTGIFVRGDVPCIVPQVLYEFWVVSTRPLKDNGRGLDVGTVAAEVATIRADFVLFDDGPRILPAWETLVTTFAVTGKPAHDACLVAAMRVHGLTHLLTFNGADFARYPITVLDPAAVAAPPAP